MRDRAYEAAYAFVYLTILYRVANHWLHLSNETVVSLFLASFILLPGDIIF